MKSIVKILILAFSIGLIICHGKEEAQTLKDSKTGLVFYIESDRRHIVAIDDKGNVRWLVDIADSKFTDKKVVIRNIEILDGVLSVNHGPLFSNSTIDIKTGALRFRGTD